LCEFSDDEWMNAEADAGETKREAIRDRYVPLMAPVFFPADPTKPDIVQLFASLLRVVGMEDKGWDPYAESRSVLNDLNALMQLKLPAKKFRDRELTTWRLGLLFYSHIVEMSAPYEVLANLLRFRLGKGYHPNPYYAFLTEQDRKRYRRSGLFPKKEDRDHPGAGRRGGFGDRWHLRRLLSQRFPQRDRALGFHFHRHRLPVQERLWEQCLRAHLRAG
jgi:hypothetical protein